MDGQVYYKQDLTGKLAVVIGSEGAGISQLVKKKCRLCSFHAYDGQNYVSERLQCGGGSDVRGEKAERWKIRI